MSSKIQNTRCQMSKVEKWKTSPSASDVQTVAQRRCSRQRVTL
jgi:hypothetical protein